MHEEDARPELYELDDGRVIGVEADVRPDSLYGASKAFGEALARFHVDRHGMTCVCLRIGSVVDAPDPGDAPPGTDVWSVTPREVRRRLRATWLSHRDCASLFAAGLDAPVRWAVAYGASANPRRIWDIESAREAIGFVPADAAPGWLWAATEETQETAE
jgi:NAD+ dependent glucose-6-phosphate dehydrogenase